MLYSDDRLTALEQRLEEIAERVGRLEGLFGAGRPQAQARPAAPPPPAPRPTSPPPPAAARREAAPRSAVPTLDLEALLGGRVLAWIGGSAILLGVVFFLVIAIRRGWIDEPTRTALAFLGSTALLVAGVWLYERRGQTPAALAAVASAISALYATLVVATQLYELVSPEVGLAAAALVGAVATTLAVRWASPLVAALGIVGALLAPVLVDAGTSGVALAFMALALSAAVGVLLWQRWDWLAVGAFLVSVPQLLAWIGDAYEERLVLTLAVLLGFWALYVVAAVGYELRVASPKRLPVSSWLLLLANVLLVAGTGYFVLEETGHGDAATAWVLGVAAAHILLGAFALRQALNREIGSLLVAAGLALSAIGFADVLHGPVLVAGWAVHAVVLAWLARRAPAHENARFGSDSMRLIVASAGYLALAYGHIVLFEAPLNALRQGVDDLPRALVALAVTALASIAVARLHRPTLEWTGALEALGVAAVVYLASIAIVDLCGATAAGEPRQAGQVLLSGFWSVTGLVAVVYGLLRDDRRSRLGGLALLGLAIAKVFVYDLAELEELYRVLSFIALGLLLLAGAFAYARIRVNVSGEEVPR